MRSLILLFTLGTLSANAADGVVAELKGKLSRTRGATTTELKKGDPVQAGDRLETGADSRATIRLGESAALILPAKSKIVVVPQRQRDKSVIQLMAGGVLSHVKSSNTKQKFEVKTPAAVIGIRGTTFYAQTGVEKGDYLCSCYGKVSVAPTKLGATPQILTGSGHDIPKIIADGSVTKTDLKIGHSEADVAELKALVGE